MSIATNLQGLFSSRTAMQTSIKNKDGSIDTDGSKMADIADLIRQLGSGSSGSDSPSATNGETWIRSNITSTSTGNPVYGLGVWAAGTHYSTDGKNWIECTSAGGTNVLRRYDYSSTSGGFVSYSGSTIYYSADGKTWESVFTVPDGSTIGNITYSDSYYVGYSGSFTFKSSTGSSWSSKDWSYGVGLILSSNSRFLTTSAGILYSSTNGSTWSVAFNGGRAYLNDWCLCPNGGYYYTAHNVSTALESQNRQGGLYYNGSQLYNDPADLHYSIGSSFGNYVSIGSSYNGTQGSGIYYNGSKVSSMPLTPEEDGIQYRLTYYHNDGDFTKIPYKNYSTSGTIYTGYYNESVMGAITADNGIYIDQAGYYSYDASTWTQCKDDNDVSVVFSAPPTYANGIWVAKSNRGLIYSLA